MTDSFLDQIKNQLDAERDADWSVAPAEAHALMARYPADTPAGFEKIEPAEFFDGAL
ncbi:MAG: hypothetical protein RLZZ106_133 [Cyanobacteriota bacterium]|jgi:hypothetical protein